METIVKNRLSKHLEENKLITPNQSGFRQHRSTIDQVIRLYNDIQTAKHQHKQIASIFIDFEKAFDLLWTDGLLYKLKTFGITGNIFVWISNFLKNRTLRVKIGSTTSEVYSFENGTPQGSVISPLLFNIMVNDLGNKLQTCTNISQFADDSAVSTSNKNIKKIEDTLQKDIDNIVAWTIT